MNIKHSKYKNTAILFEILVKRITADTMSNNQSPALGLLRKYFYNTELGKEYKIYETITKSRNISESKASDLINTALEATKRLNKGKLKKEKYNLVKELKENYNLDDLFGIRVREYKIYASIYNLIEIHNTTKPINVSQVLENRTTLLEYLTQSSISIPESDKIIEEFKSHDKDVRILTYKILLERFNKKYSGLNPKQKRILKEFIESVDSTNTLKEFYNKEISLIHKELTDLSKSTTEKVIQIKLSEVLKHVKALDKNEKVNSQYIVDLLQYHTLIDELQAV